MEKILLEHLWIVIAILLLTVPLKAAALWRAARRGHISWFLALIILNTLGILDLLYIFVFSKWGRKKTEKVDESQQIKYWHEDNFQEENQKEEYLQKPTNESKFSINSRKNSVIKKI